MENLLHKGDARHERDIHNTWEMPPKNINIDNHPKYDDFKANHKHFYNEYKIIKRTT